MKAKLNKRFFALYGRNSVLERLRINPRSVRKILLSNNFDSLQIKEIIKANKIPTEYLPQRSLAKLKRGENTQGVVAIVDKFEYAKFDDLLGRYQDKRPTLIFLDRIYDPQNLGAIIRIAACLGRFAVIVPRDKACEVNETVLRIASGGENYVPVSLVSNLTNSIILAKKFGYWIIGAVISENAEDINKVSFPFPLGFVLGSEGEGIRYGVQKHLDIRVSIPMNGAKLSFNVAVACAIFCYEISKQRDSHASKS